MNAILPASLIMFSSVFLASCGALFLVLFFDYLRMLYLRHKLPPGPFPFPLVGNHFQTPAYKPWVTWESWAQHYDSPLMTLWIGRHPRIIISDAWVAADLLERRSDIFSSRPRLVVMGDLTGSTKTNVTALVHGERWRMHRKLMHSVVGTQAIRKYRTFQADESKLLTRDLLRDAANFVLAVERYSISIVSIIGFGRRIDQTNDRVAQVALNLMQSVTDYVVPGIYLVEAVPQLMYLPAWLYKLPSSVRTGAAIGWRYFYMLTQEGAKPNEHSFSKTVFDAQQTMKLSEVEVAGLVGNLLGGGIDTTSSTMLSCILAMAAFPAVQKKAQAELDRVIGTLRSPTWSDVDNNKLPYLAALVKEVLRWRTVTTLGGIPHANKRAVEYKNYFFPAGTNFTQNVWANHRHPRDFPDPDVFRPERFLNGDGNPYPNRFGCNPFGWGRRVCVGQPLAEQGLLFSLGRLIWALKILPALDEEGNEVELDIFAYTNSENTRPEHFEVRFVPRSEEIKDLISKEAEEARERLRVYDGETNVAIEDAAWNPAYA